jgi:hypothetical protein
MPDFKNIYTLRIPPGIERDGTTFSRKAWTNGVWTRFYRGNAYKMGGYTQIAADTPVGEICRGIIIVPSVASSSPTYNVFLGTYNNCYYFSIDNDGNVLSGPDLINITPDGFEADLNNTWTFDLAPYSGTESGTALIANAAPNLGSISNNVPTQVYFTDAYNPIQLGALTYNQGTSTEPDIVPLMTDGGIVTLFPYLFAYGSGGFLKWIDMSKDVPFQEGDTSVSGFKIVAGTSVRGGNSSPGGLFWALDRLVRATFVPDAAGSLDFSFDSISSETSVLSQNAWIEYDSLYYWVAIDRFLLYNGIVQELPNSNSLDFFFTNLNFDAKEKVFTTKNTHWGEIWWFFPTGTNTECDHAVIYNVREQLWYDTPVTRSAAAFSQTFPLPIWTDNQPDSTGGYPIWLQESGYDRRDNDPATPAVIPINANITTPVISYAASDFDSQSEELDNWSYVYRVELDINQSGPMTLTVNGTNYARPSDNDEDPENYIFQSTDFKIDMREQRRLLTFKFTSNTLGGFYQLGRILIVATPGDARQ